MARVLCVHSRGHCVSHGVHLACTVSFVRCFSPEQSHRSLPIPGRLLVARPVTHRPRRCRTARARAHRPRAAAPLQPWRASPPASAQEALARRAWRHSSPLPCPAPSSRPRACLGGQQPARHSRWNVSTSSNAPGACTRLEVLGLRCRSFEGSLRSVHGGSQLLRGQQPSLRMQLQPRLHRTKSLGGGDLLRLRGKRLRWARQAGTRRRAACLCYGRTSRHFWFRPCSFSSASFARRCAAAARRVASDGGGCASDAACAERAASSSCSSCCARFCSSAACRTAKRASAQHERPGAARVGGDAPLRTSHAAPARACAPWQP